MTIDHFIEHQEKLVSELNLKEFYLYGQSWGAIVALEYYLKYPKGVKGIIFSSPLLNTDKWISDSKILIRTLPDSLQEAIKVAEKTKDFTNPKYLEAENEFYNRFLMRSSYVQEDWGSSPADFNMDIYYYMWGPSEFVCSGTLKNYDGERKLEKIGVPTLFITGEFDEARPETVKMFSDQVSNSSFEVIEGAAHATLFDNLEDNLKVIRNFLEKID
jgi:proline iminopeptidase